MFVLTAVQVDLSLGSIPNRVQTPFVISAACSSVKAFGILEILVRYGILKCNFSHFESWGTHFSQPLLRKCSFCSGVRTGSTAMMVF